MMDTKRDLERRLIRHCMVVHNCYPFDETRVQREAEALVESGFEVDVICLRQDNEPTIERVDSVNIFRLPIRRKRKHGRVAQLFDYCTGLFLTFLHLSRLHLKRRYHVVQIHNLPDFLVFAALIPRLMGCKVILDIHDLMPEFYCSRFKCSFDSLPVRLVRLQERLSCRFAHHVITVTERWRQTLISRGVAPNKCSVVMNVADTRYFATALAEHHRSRSGQFQLIYHGSLTYRYGLDLALRALDLVRREISDVHLTVHGRGEYLEELVELIEELELKAFVRIDTRFLSLRELNEVIVAADVGLVPYRSDIFTDGILPTKLMEYVALNVPVIAARTPCIRDYFDHKMVEFFTAGKIDELANCILTLDRDRNRLSELARNARVFHERYNWPDQARQYVCRVRGMANANG
jgi:glycosyltransferase involved in cell wall biosynthesis